MRFRDVATRLSVVILVMALAACGGTFRTYYDESPDATNWRVTSVDVSVPRTLVVSEEEIFLPKADIVWREDAAGDRYEQVAAIMKNAIGQGAAGLKGDRPVRFEVTMARFHAMTFLAETRAPGGVHDIEFTITALDAESGKVLAGPDYIEASFPAMTGATMSEARVQGETQKSQITSHVARTIASWLGTGPDARRTFSSLGG
ncbi:DUF6778 family protein [Defluviimonas sp. SAOS-178_SWC]|uniref:DUF6778 family protein n=1 Tax=Defluviimonas sp. SAOS-178_SWC TaxID=3121287 RepID=UPI003221C5B6